MIKELRTYFKNFHKLEKYNSFYTFNFRIEYHMTKEQILDYIYDELGKKIEYIYLKVIEVNNHDIELELRYRKEFNFFDSTGIHY